jgi:DMSO/TMAO reductase YedYZ molybdopterin-dependent catalytic subunit
MAVRSTLTTAHLSGSSVRQYGFVSTKHLSSIELHTSEPPESYRHASAKSQVALRLLAPHPRARVWKEERHRYLPAW